MTALDWILLVCGGLALSLGMWRFAHVVETAETVDIENAKIGGSSIAAIALGCLGIAALIGSFSAYHGWTKAAFCVSSGFVFAGIGVSVATLTASLHNKCRCKVPASPQETEADAAQLRWQPRKREYLASLAERLRTVQCEQNRVLLDEAADVIEELSALLCEEDHAKGNSDQG